MLAGLTTKLMRWRTGGFWLGRLLAAMAAILLACGVGGAPTRQKKRTGGGAKEIGDQR
jgi:hypothetical protein